MPADAGIFYFWGFISRRLHTTLLILISPAAPACEIL
jgi:hypothetical protein